MHESAPPIGCEPLISVVKGDSTSGVMEEVLAQCLPAFYRTAYRFPGNSADVEDGVHALLSAYKHLHEFRGESQLSTWLT
jgi:DNA-directed RNA polymerase specialized sigma24 family protein